MLGRQFKMRQIQESPSDLTNQQRDTNMKTIIVRWVPEAQYGYGSAMRVIESDHPRFTVGSRFDYGYFGIATDEGYTIISLPLTNKETP